MNLVRPQFNSAQVHHAATLRRLRGVTPFPEKLLLRKTFSEALKYYGKTAYAVLFALTGIRSVI